MTEINEKDMENAVGGLFSSGTDRELVYVFSTCEKYEPSSEEYRNLSSNQHMCANCAHFHRGGGSSPNLGKCDLK